MKLLKKTNKHSMWEVWSETMAESVYVDHRPTKKELEEILWTRWKGRDSVDTLMVFKLEPYYTKNCLADGK